MKKPVAISLSPNTTKADVRRAWEVLLTPVFWRRGMRLPDIAHRLSAMHAGRSVALTSSGRQALYDTLRALGIGQNKEVIIQAFTCIAVPEPIMWAGAVPVYADIKQGTYNIDPDDVRRKITSRTRAIIVQHTFGMPGPIEELQAIAREHNLILIEDCAHALGGTYKDKPLGTFGDAAILSFGRDKVVSSVFGGAVVSARQDIIHAINSVGKQRSYPPATWVAQQLLHPILFSVILPTYFSGLGKALLVAAQKVGLLSKAVEAGEKRGAKPQHFAYRFSPALGQLLDLQLTQLPQFTKRRQEIVAKYLKAFANIDKAPEWSLRLLRFPLLVDNPNQMRAAAREKKMLLGDWYDAPLAPKDSSLGAFGYTPGSCPVAEETAKKVINLPTYPSMTDGQVERVISFVKNFKF